ncbi:hypothetical protein BLNAU_22454 [Blattamonas nauphoetae]|uniref:Uncharacterized protein n=1 Tax=Blattamonas nauphoetae TaxID=2049346 RepID=A0ABQ9WT17_9EUKA|nr:hypothetical protein BLNAU_22454 [Blattamonas nauphoetae]
MEDHSDCIVHRCVLRSDGLISPFECRDSKLLFIASTFHFDTPSNTAQSIANASTISSTVSFSACSLQNVVCAQDSLLTSSQVKHTIIVSCCFQNISRRSPLHSQNTLVEVPFNVTISESTFSDCVNALSGGIVRDVEDQTTLCAMNSTFTGTITNGETEGDTFSDRAEAVVVDTDHTFISCVFSKCHAFKTTGGAIRCLSGASLNVTKCVFTDNWALDDRLDPSFVLSTGGAIYFDGRDTGGLTIVHSLFERNTASFGGSVSSKKAHHLTIQYSNITNGECIIYENPDLSYGGGLACFFLPLEAIVQNVRFLNCKTVKTGGSIDCQEVSGSIRFSNIFVANSACEQGNVIFSSVSDETAVIQFFSCTFFSNTLSADPSLNIPTDVRFNDFEPWTTLLKSKSTFVNCFSTSAEPRIAIITDNGFLTSFEYDDPGNTTKLDVHLPSPGVIVNGQDGVDGDGCGIEYTDPCKTVAYTGANRTALAGGTVLIEAGTFEETDCFDLETKSAKFTSFGDISPMISYSLADDAVAFITKGTGTVRFELLHFVPSSSAHVILQNGSGNLEVWNCSFVGTEDMNSVIHVAILKATEGTVSLTSTSFSGLTFADAQVVECVGSSTKLEITLCQFIEMKGATPALIVFEPTNPGSSEAVVASLTVIGEEGSAVGGVKLANVDSIKLEDVKMAHLKSVDQNAAVSISDCSSLALSSLLFEHCSGSVASDLFVAAPSVTIASPLPSSFSVSATPTSSINGVASDVILPRPFLAVDGQAGDDDFWCWATGCSSLSSLVPRLASDFSWSTTLKSETLSEQGIEVNGGCYITIKGTTKDGTILQHSSSVASSLIFVSSESLSLATLTLASSFSGKELSTSFCMVTGGQLSLESVILSSLPFSDTASLFAVAESGTLALLSLDVSTLTITRFVNLDGGNAIVSKSSFSNTKLTSSMISGSGVLTIDSTSFSSLSPIAGMNGEARILSFEVGEDQTLMIGEENKPVSFESCSSSGDGGVMHLTLLQKGTLAMKHTSFKLCSTEGRGGAILLDMTQSSPSSFSFSDVSFGAEADSTSCSAGRGNGVFCLIPKGDRITHLSTIRDSLLPPTPSDETPFSLESIALVEFGEVLGDGHEEDVGSALYAFYPASSSLHLNAPVGADHPLCGDVHLPCRSVEQGYSNIALETTSHSLLLKSEVVLNSKLETEDKTVTIMSNHNELMTVGENGQLHVRVGKLIFSAVEIVLPSSFAQTVFLVTGGTLILTSSSTITHSGTSVSKSLLDAPLFSVRGGHLKIEGTKDKIHLFSFFQKCSVLEVSGSQSPSLTLTHCHFTQNSVSTEAVVVLRGDGGTVWMKECYFKDNTGKGSSDVWGSSGWSTGLTKDSIQLCFSESNMDHLVVGGTAANILIPFSVLTVHPSDGDDGKCDEPEIACKSVHHSLSLCTQTEKDGTTPALRMIEMLVDVTESHTLEVGSKDIALYGHLDSGVQLKWDSASHTMLSVTVGNAFLHDFELVHLHPSLDRPLFLVVDVGSLILKSIVMDGGNTVFGSCLIKIDAGSLSLESGNFSNIKLHSFHNILIGDFSLEFVPSPIQ